MRPWRDVEREGRGVERFEERMVRLFEVDWFEATEKPGASLMARDESPWPSVAAVEYGELSEDWDRQQP